MIQEKRHMNVEEMQAILNRAGLKIRSLDGEAELYIPAKPADQILPAFGAKVRRELSPAQKAVLERARNSLNLLSQPSTEGVPGVRNDDPAPLPLPAVIDQKNIKP